MDSNTVKQLLLGRLQQQRDAILWKASDLSEAEARRPLTPTGTNLLGLVQHLAVVEYGHFQLAFGRPCPDLAPLRPDADPSADFVVPDDVSPAETLQLYRDAITASDATIAEHDLDSPAQVPWWPEPTTLAELLVHTAVETARHAGHADIVRELIDGRAGYVEGMTLLHDEA